MDPKDSRSPFSCCDLVNWHDRFALVAGCSCLTAIIDLKYKRIRYNRSTTNYALIKEYALNNQILWYSICMHIYYDVSLWLVFGYVIWRLVMKNNKMEKWTKLLKSYASFLGVCCNRGFYKFPGWSLLCTMVHDNKMEKWAVFWSFNPCKLSRMVFGVHCNRMFYKFLGRSLLWTTTVVHDMCICAKTVISKIVSLYLYIVSYCRQSCLLLKFLFRLLAAIVVLLLEYFKLQKGHYYKVVTISKIICLSSRSIIPNSMILLQSAKYAFCCCTIPVVVDRGLWDTV